MRSSEEVEAEKAAQRAAADPNFGRKPSKAVLRRARSFRVTSNPHGESFYLFMNLPTPGRGLEATDAHAIDYHRREDLYELLDEADLPVDRFERTGNGVWTPRTARIEGGAPETDGYSLVLTEGLIFSPRPLTETVEIYATIPNKVGAVTRVETLVTLANSYVQQFEQRDQLASQRKQEKEDRRQQVARL